jgi:hypothetical protein
MVPMTEKLRGWMSTGMTGLPTVVRTSFDAALLPNAFDATARM